VAKDVAKVILNVEISVSRTAFSLKLVHMHMHVDKRGQVILQSGAVTVSVGNLSLVLISYSLRINLYACAHTFTGH